MGSLYNKVRTKLSLYAHRKVAGLLEGEYGSVFKGRSMDFDDLRAYIPGDDVKDIDWSATARSGQTLIRRYIAIRKHNVMIVTDTGRNMMAVSEGGEVKKNIAVMVSGVMGYIVLKHGDLISLVAGDSEQNSYLPLKSDSTHLEHILQRINATSGSDTAKSNILVQLEYVARTMRRRMIMVVIADEIPYVDELRVLLRRLRVQHEIVWVTVADADLTAEPLITDVAFPEINLPEFVRRNPQVIDEYKTSQTQAREEFSHSLAKLGIASVIVSNEAEVPTKLFSLLEKQRYAKRV